MWRGDFKRMPDATLGWTHPQEDSNDLPWTFDLEAGPESATYRTEDLFGWDGPEFTIHVQSLDNEDALDAAILDALFKLGKLTNDLSNYWVRWSNPSKALLMDGDDPQFRIFQV